MPFVRDTVPRKGNLRSLQSYLERTLERLDDWARITDARVLELERLRAINGIHIRYQWDDNTDMGITVAPGFMKMNDANPTVATQYMLSRFDEFGREALVIGIFDTPVSTGYFQAQDYSRATAPLYIYEIAGPTVSNPEDVILTVAVLSAVGPSPQTADLMEASYWPEALPSGRSSGRVF